MWSLSFTACSFSVREKNSRVGFVNLNQQIVCAKLNKRFDSILDTIKYFFEINRNIKDCKSDQRLFSSEILEKYCGENDKVRYLFGKISSGRYGMELSILNSTTRKEVYRQKIGDAPMMEFYVLVVVPKDTKEIKVQKGMLFFQNIGQYGIKTETTTYLKEYFSDFFNYTMWSGNISPEVFLRTILKRENINKFHMIKNVVSSDRSDSLGGLRYGREERTFTRLVISENFISKIKGFLEGGCQVFEFENKNYDDVKVEVDLGGRPRKISLSNVNNLSIIEGLPDDLRERDSGKIDEERLKTILVNNAEEYMKTMVFTVIKKGE